MPVVRRIVRESARDNYRFSTLITEIVTNAPFDMKMKIGNDTEGRPSRRPLGREPRQRPLSETGDLPSCSSPDCRYLAARSCVE